MSGFDAIAAIDADFVPHEFRTLYNRQRFKESKMLMSQSIAQATLKKINSFVPFVPYRSRFPRSLACASMALFHY